MKSFWNGLSKPFFVMAPMADGSVKYVDLRFDGKVYLKKKAEQKQ